MAATRRLSVARLNVAAEHRRVGELGLTERLHLAAESGTAKEVCAGHGRPARAPTHLPLRTHAWILMQWQHVASVLCMRATTVDS
jgi:hypothetical protein